MPRFDLILLIMLTSYYSVNTMSAKPNGGTVTHDLSGLSVSHALFGAKYLSWKYPMSSMPAIY